MSYGWMINKDYVTIEGEETDVNIVGPRDIPDGILADLSAGKGNEFRLYDDDGNLYYSGLYIGDGDGFEPLDDYGMPNDGATEIRYRHSTTEWRTL